MANVNHTFVEQTTEQTHTGDTVFTDISGAEITSGNFIVGNKYLIMTNAQIGGSGIDENFAIQTLHGSTAFAESEYVMEPSQVASNEYQKSYTWFTVWTAVASEGIKLQFKTLNSVETVKADQITLTAIELTEFTENTDWFFDFNNTSTALDATFSSTNNASVTFTPSEASDWLVLSYDTIEPDSTDQFISRLETTGGISSTEPLTSVEGEDPTLDKFNDFMTRAFSLTAVSHTFTLQARNFDGAGGARTNSSIFAINLNKFKKHSFAYTEGTVAGTAGTSEVQTTSITPDSTSDNWVGSFFVFHPAGSGGQTGARMQVDNVDQPPTQTSDDYLAIAVWDGADLAPFFIQSVENLDNTAHDVDVDVFNTDTGQSYGNRLAFAVTLETPVAVNTKTFLVDARLDVGENELIYDFVEVTTDQSHTGSTAWTDIPSATIPSGFFVTGRKYLLVMTTQAVGSNINTNYGVRTQHGSTTFDGSQHVFEPNAVATRSQYSYFNVWTAVEGEDIQMQFQTMSAGQTVSADQTTLFALEISEQFIEGLDWHSDTVLASTVLNTTPSTSNNATITFTPPVASHDWLVITEGCVDTDALNVLYTSRTARSGEATSTTPSTTQEGEDAPLDLYVQTVFRVFTLGNASNTFEQEAFKDISQGPNSTREYSSVFAINLNRFKSHSFAYTDGTILLDTTDDLSTSTQVQTDTLAPTTEGNTWIMGSFVTGGNAFQEIRARMQVDNVDQVPTQTSDNYQQLLGYDPDDENNWAMQTVEDLDTSSHTTDLDVSAETGSPSDRTAQFRNIFEVRLESSLVTNDEDFFIDALLQATFDEEFQVDALLQATFDEEFIVDARIKQIVDKEFIVDALIQTQNIDKEFIVDALLQATFIEEFQVDAVLQATFIEEFQVDAFIKAFDQNFNFLVDAFIQAENQKLFIVDVLLRATFEEDFIVDARLIVRNIEEFQVDARLIVRNIEEFQVDAFIQQQNNEEDFFVDALLQATFTQDFFVDALLQATFTEDLFVDSILQATFDEDFFVDAFIQQQDNDKEFIVDALIQTQNIDKEFIVDAVLQATFIEEFLVDAFLKAFDQEETFDVNGFRQRQNINKEFIVDAVLVELNVKEFVVGKLLQSEQTFDFLVDAFIQADNEFMFIVDALLQSTFDEEFFVDALLKAFAQEETFIVDGLLNAVQEKDFFVDALLQDTFDEEFQVNALLEITNDKDFFVDSLLQATFDEEFIVDAQLLKLNEEDFFVDALTKKVQTKEFIVNALLQATFEEEFIVDARLAVRKNFQVDARLVRETKTEVDGILQATIDEDFFVDSILKQGNQEFFIVDAFLVVVNSTTFFVNAILAEIKEHDFFVDALLQSPANDKEFIVDVLLAEVKTHDFFVNAILVAIAMEEEFQVDALIQMTGDILCAGSGVKFSDSIPDATGWTISGTPGQVRVDDASFPNVIRLQCFRSRLYSTAQAVKSLGTTIQSLNEDIIWEFEHRHLTVCQSFQANYEFSLTETNTITSDISQGSIVFRQASVGSTAQVRAEVKDSSGGSVFTSLFLISSGGPVDTTFHNRISIINSGANLKFEVFSDPSRTSLLFSDTVSTAGVNNETLSWIQVSPKGNGGLARRGVEEFDDILVSTSACPRIEVDSFLKQVDQEQEFIVDARLVGLSFEKEFIVDGIVQAPLNEVDFFVNAILKKLGQELDFIVDGNVGLLGQEEDFFVSAVLAGFGFEKEFQVDAFLKAFDQVLDFQVDAITFKVPSKLLELDALLTLLDQEKDFFVDAKVAFVEIEEFIVDAILKAIATIDKEFIVDGLLSGAVNEEEFQVDALILRTGDVLCGGSSILHQEDFTTNAGWTNNGGSAIQIDSGSFPNVMRLVNLTSITFGLKKATKTLTNQVEPDKNFVWEFKHDHLAGGSTFASEFTIELKETSNDKLVGASADETTVRYRTDVVSSSGPEDLRLEVFDNNGINSVFSPQSSITLQDNFVYYPRITKMGTIVKLELFTDAGRTTQETGSPVQVDTTGFDFSQPLNTIYVGNYGTGGSARTSNEELDDILILDALCPRIQVDSVLKAFDQELEFQVDAHLRLLGIEEFQVDAQLVANVPETTTIEVNAIVGFFTKFDVNALLKASNQEHEFIVDAKLVRDIITNVDAFIKRLGVNCALGEVFEDNIPSNTGWDVVNVAGVQIRVDGGFFPNQIQYDSMGNALSNRLNKLIDQGQGGLVEIDSFSEIRLDFKYQHTGDTGVGDGGMLMGITDVNDKIMNNKRFGVRTRQTGSQFQIRLQLTDGIQLRETDWLNIPLNQDVFITANKVGSNIFLEVFSDSERTIGIGGSPTAPVSTSGLNQVIFDHMGGSGNDVLSGQTEISGLLDNISLSTRICTDFFVDGNLAGGQIEEFEVNALLVRQHMFTCDAFIKAIGDVRCLPSFAEKIFEDDLDDNSNWSTEINSTTVDGWDTKRIFIDGEDPISEDGSNGFVWASMPPGGFGGGDTPVFKSKYRRKQIGSEGGIGFVRGDNFRLEFELHQTVGGEGSWIGLNRTGFHPQNDPNTSTFQVNSGSGEITATLSDGVNSVTTLPLSWIPVGEESPDPLFIVVESSGGFLTLNAYDDPEHTIHNGGSPVTVGTGTIEKEELGMEWLFVGANSKFLDPAEPTPIATIDNILIYSDPCPTIRIDARLKELFSKEFTVNALLTRRVQFEVDAKLRGRKDFTVNAVLVRFKEFQVNAILDTPIIFEFFVNALLKEFKLEIEVFVDAILVRSIVFTIDAVTSTPSSDPDFSESHMLDIVPMFNIDILEFIVDGITAGRRTFEVDARLATRKFFDLDAVLSTEPQILIFSSTHLQDITPIFAIAQPDFGFFVNALLKELNQDTQWRINALLTNRFDEEFIVNAILISITKTVEPKVNALLKTFDQEHDFFSDARLVDRFIEEFIVNVLLQAVQEKDFFVNAVLKAFNQDTQITINAILVVEREFEYRVDGLIKRLGDNGICNFFPEPFEIGTGLDSFEQNPITPAHEGNVDLFIGQEFTLDNQQIRKITILLRASQFPNEIINDLIEPSPIQGKIWANVIKGNPAGEVVVATSDNSIDAVEASGDLPAGVWKETVFEFDRDTSPFITGTFLVGFEHFVGNEVDNPEGVGVAKPVINNGNAIAGEALFRRSDNSGFADPTEWQELLGSEIDLAINIEIVNGNEIIAGESKQCPVMDAQIQAKDQEQEFFTDAQLIPRKIDIFDTSALLQAQDQEEEFIVNAILIGTATFEVDARLFAIGVNDEEFEVNGILLLTTVIPTKVSARLVPEDANLETFDVNGFRQATQTFSPFFDALIKALDQEKDFFANVILQATFTEEPEVNAVLKAFNQEEEFQVNSILVVRKVHDFVVNALLKLELHSFRVDAQISEREQRETKINAILSDKPEQDFFVNGILTKLGVEEEFIVNSILQATFNTDFFIVDAQLSEGNVGDFFVSGLLSQDDQEEEFFINSILIKRGKFQVDAFIQAKGGTEFNGNNGSTNAFAVNPFIEQNQTVTGVPVPVGTNLCGQRLRLPTSPVRIIAFQFRMFRDGLSGSPVGTLEGRIYRNSIAGNPISAGDLLDSSDNIVQLSELTTNVLGDNVVFNFSTVEITPDDNIFVGIQITGTNEEVFFNVEGLGTVIEGGDFTTESAGNWGVDTGVDANMSITIDDEPRQRGSAIMGALVGVFQHDFIIDGTTKAENTEEEFRVNAKLIVRKDTGTALQIGAILIGSVDLIIGAFVGEVQTTVLDVESAIVENNSEFGVESTLGGGGEE